MPDDFKGFEVGKRASWTETRRGQKWGGGVSFGAMFSGAAPRPVGAEKGTNRKIGEKELAAQRRNGGVVVTEELVDMGFGEAIAEETSEAENTRISRKRRHQRVEGEPVPKGGEPGLRTQDLLWLTRQTIGRQRTSISKIRKSLEDPSDDATIAWFLDGAVAQGLLCRVSRDVWAGTEASEGWLLGYEERIATRLILVLAAAVPVAFPTPPWGIIDVVRQLVRDAALGPDSLAEEAVMLVAQRLGLLSQPEWDSERRTQHFPQGRETLGEFLDLGD